MLKKNYHSQTMSIYVLLIVCKRVKLKAVFIVLLPVIYRKEDVICDS